MAMREGYNGPDLFEACRRKGIAAIGYRGRNLGCDWSRFSIEEFRKRWKKNGWPVTARKYCEYMLFDMKPGDVIYAKSGPRIVGRGTVTRGYGYDPTILQDERCDWPHYVRVEWESSFRPFRCLLESEQSTIFKLNEARIEKVRKAEARAGNGAAKVPVETPEAVRNGDEGGRSSVGGGGFGDYEQNCIVEQAAVSCVIDKYKRDGWAVKSVERERCGYDLQCTRGNAEAHVEVKGVSGDALSFPITPNEVRAARADKAFRLCVVTMATSTLRRPHEFTGAEFLSKFTLVPVQYMAHREH
jgi:hypothetical protein